MSFGGFVKHMNDVIRFNRAILGKRKSIRELYKDEVRNRSSTFDNVNIDHVRSRVAEKLKRNRIKEILTQLTAVTLLCSFIGFIIWVFLSVDFSIKPEEVNKAALFRKIIYRDVNGHDLKVEYFLNGPKAAETYLLDGYKHDSSVSYYETGEKFRFAVYSFDSLVTEVYFFKSGDTIPNFPVYPDEEIHTIELTHHSRRIEFDLYDGKIIQGTYTERRDLNE